MGKIIYPCRRCAFYSSCGSYARTEPCEYRKNKGQVQKAVNRFRRQVERG